MTISIKKLPFTNLDFLVKLISTIYTYKNLELTIFIKFINKQFKYKI